MVFFPLLMWYMWVGQVYYNSQFPLPEKGLPFGDFMLGVVNKAMEVGATLCNFMSRKTTD
jgi:delta24(24(1))-sterol reductase